MRWQVKAAGHVALAVAPGGTRLHRWLQEAAGTTGPDDVLTEYERKAQFLRRFARHGIRLEGASVLEIGTGWHPVLPVLLSVLGARRTVTVDLRPWLTARTLEETAAGLESVAERMPADLGIPAEAARDALGELRAASAAGLAPDEAMRQIGVEVRWPVDATATGLPASIFDCAISSNVLEHVPPDGVRAMLAECRRLLRPGGTTAHHVDPGDHFTGDARITSVNFLKFSPLTWRLIGSGLAYHNRLRCPDYPPLFEQAGFMIEGVDVETDEHALEQLRAGAIRPHATFAEYSDEELAGALIDVFARVPGQPARGAQDLT